MLCHLMQNQLVRIDFELEKDRPKDLEIRELNDTEKFTSQAHLTFENIVTNLL